MTINLNNSATEKIPPSGKICPLVQWILVSTAFILFALFEYFLILVVLRFSDKLNGDTFSEITLNLATQMGGKATSRKVSDNKGTETVRNFFVFRAKFVFAIVRVQIKSFLFSRRIGRVL